MSSITRDFLPDPQAAFDSFFSNVTESLPAVGRKISFTDFLKDEIDREEWGIDLTIQQMTILKTFYGEPLTEQEQSILDYWKLLNRTTYEPEMGHFSRAALILECGRRGGKSLKGSIIAWYEFVKLILLGNPQKYYGVSSNTKISILCIAPSATQTKRTIYGQIKDMIPVLPRIKSLVDQGKIIVGEEEIKYPDKLLYIYSGNSKGSTQVGSSIIALILDEVARFENKDGESNALDLWNNIGASGLTFKEDAIKVAISSAWAEGDAIEQLYKAATRETSYIGFQLESKQVNPIFASDDNPVVKSAFAVNPANAMLEFYGIRSANKAQFFTADMVKRAFTGIARADIIRLPDQPDHLVRLQVRNVIPPKGTTITYCHLDPALSSCAYALAFGHLELNKEGVQVVVVDGLSVWEPDGLNEVSISNVYEVLTDIHRVRPLSLVSSDQSGHGSETLQRLRLRGIDTAKMTYSNQMQVKIYTTVNNLLSEGRLILPKNSPWSFLLRKEMLGIIEDKGKITFRGASTTFADDDDAPTGSKDVIDAVAGLCWQLIGKNAISVTSTSSTLSSVETLKAIPISFKQSTRMSDLDFVGSRQRSERVYGRGRFFQEG